MSQAPPSTFKVRLRKPAVTGDTQCGSESVKSRGSDSACTPSVSSDKRVTPPRPAMSSAKLQYDSILTDLASRLNIPSDKLSTPQLKVSSASSAASLGTDQLSLHRLNFSNCSSNCFTRSLNAYRDQQQKLEIKHKLKLFEQNSELVKKLQNFHAKVEFEECGEEREQPEKGDSHSADKYVNIAHADESVAEVSKDRFEPKYVKQINFEILKLPNSEQKIPTSAAKNGEENIASSSSKVPGRNSTAKSKKKLTSGSQCSLEKHSLPHFPAKEDSSHRLRPLNLDPYLASAQEPSMARQLGEQQPCSKSVSSLSTISEDGSSAPYQPSLATSLPQVNKLDGKFSKPCDSVPKLKSLKRMGQWKEVKKCGLAKPESKRPVARGSEGECQSAVAPSKPAVMSVRNIHVNNKSYLFLNKIGRGGSSTVYQVFDPELNNTVALKKVDLSGSDESVVTGFRNEIKLLGKLRNCDRVVKMYDYEFRNGNKELLIVMEKGDDDLASVLSAYCKTETRLSPHLIRFYWQEMLKVVNEIHQRNIVHSDLKPVNFILVSGKLKLIDFGIANAIQSNKTSVYKDCIIGTVDYMAPESCKKSVRQNGKQMIRYNQKADIWSLGILLYNLVYGFTPFSHIKDNFKKIVAITNCQIEYPKIEDKLLLNVIKQCLQRDPNRRPTAEELLRHRYLAQSTEPSNPSTAPSTPSQPDPARGNISSELLSKISNLTPNSLHCFSELLEKFTKKPDLFV